MHALETIERINNLEHDLAKLRKAYRGQVAAENDRMNAMEKAAKYDMYTLMSVARGFDDIGRLIDEYDIIAQSVTADLSRLDTDHDDPNH